ncbi:Transmembrane protein, partial [Globisporangium splendens]
MMRPSSDAHDAQADQITSRQQLCANAIIVAYDDASCASTWPAPCNFYGCSTCPQGQVPSKDASRCMTCGNSTLGVSKDASECQCGANAILREKSESGGYLSAKECITCTNGTMASDDKASQNFCLVHLRMREWIPADHVDATEPDEVSQAESHECAQRESEPLTRKCCHICSVGYRAHSRELACARCVYICCKRVLLLPHGATESVLSAARQPLRLAALPTAVAGVCALGAHPARWPYNDRKSNQRMVLHAAFLSYGASAESVLDSTAIGMKMSFDEAAKPDTHDHLAFVLATYDYRGDLQGFQRLTTQLLYCAPPAQVGGTPSWLRFGVSTSMRYTCDLSALDATSLLLFELYLVDYSKADGDDGRYVLVPVQNRNYEDAKGSAININTRPEDVADDVLTHRFFLYDFLSGTAVGETQPKVFRYADSMTLTIRAQTKSVDAIYPPLLSISYVDTQSLRNASMRFHVAYASDTTKFWTTAMSLFIAACGFAACRVVLHTYTWQRRSTRNEELGAAMWHSIAHVLMCSASNFALASFGILLVMTNYFFVFFKWQARVYVLLPEVNYDDVAHSAAKMDEYYPLRVLLPLAFALQIVAVLHRIYAQTQNHVLFVDWETPRAKMIDADSATPQNAPISIWRTILVTNEWTTLQVRCRTSLEATIVLLLLLLYGYDLRSAAVPIPHAQMQHLGQQQMPSESSMDATLSLNLCLRFANVSCLWIALYIAQRLWKWLTYERYVDEPREMLFIDLCTVAKVSCLILDEPYHGFYLHCRSPYPFADGNMGELVDQLRQEEAGLTVGRGLDSSLPDCQSFEVFVTRKWKRKFQNLFSVMQNGGSGGPTGARKSPNNGPESLLHRRKHRPFAQQQSIWRHQHRQITQGMVKSAMQLSNFLKAFIENQDEQYRWRIYRAQTWLGHFFGIPPEVTSSKQSLFLPDTDTRFTSALFLGIENDLMVLNILVRSS